MNLVIGPDAPREDWLAARRSGIGASEIAAVMGLSPWESPFSLYWRKVNGWDIDGSEAMHLGTRLEPVIADLYAERHPDILVKPSGLYAHPDRSWQLATPDRRLYISEPDLRPLGEPEPAPTALLECKATHSLADWGEQGSDDIPVHYRTQGLWQMDVVGVDEVHFAVLAGLTYREYVLKRDEDDLAAMRAAGAEFMDRIARRDPPDIDSHTATLHALKRLHPDLEDREEEIPAAIAAEYFLARAQRASADEMVRACEIALRAAMGDARRAVCNGEKVATRAIYTTREHIRPAGKVDKLIPARSKS